MRPRSGEQASRVSHAPSLGLSTPHLCKQATAAAAGEQKALEQQGPELLAGQRPALYPACGIGS